MGGGGGVTAIYGLYRYVNGVNGMVSQVVYSRIGFINQNIWV